MSLVKGAFLVFRTQVPVPTGIVVFQFNSETLSRKLDSPEDNRPKSGAEAKGTDGSQHQTRAPTESLTVSIELDASDALDKGDSIASSVGLHPALAQLELLMYPSSAVLILNKALTAVGVSVLAPATTPTVLFVWGTERILPVQVTSVQITEQQFDDRLNPISAKADVSLKVLQEEELKQPYSTLALLGQIAKEGLADIGAVQGASNLPSILPF